jgi:hypothetical protein
MRGRRLDSARPFDVQIEIPCAKYCKISVATPRPRKFNFSTNARTLAEQKNPQPVVRHRSRVDPKPPSRRSLAQSLNPDRMSDLKIRLNSH